MCLLIRPRCASAPRALNPRGRRQMAKGASPQRGICKSSSLDAVVGGCRLTTLATCSSVHPGNAWSTRVMRMQIASPRRLLPCWRAMRCAPPVALRSMCAATTPSCWSGARHWEAPRVTSPPPGRLDSVRLARQNGKAIEQSADCQQRSVSHRHRKRMQLLENQALCCAAWYRVLPLNASPCLSMFLNASPCLSSPHF